jgi:hypothetical protein
LVHPEGFALWSPRFASISVAQIEARRRSGNSLDQCILPETVGNPGTRTTSDKLKSMGAIRRFIFWDFPRGSWQYDVMVGLILAFIFITPKTIFRDQPKAASVAILRNGFWIDPQVLSGVAESDLLSKASAAVNAKYKTHTTIVNVDPIYNDEQELEGYMAYTKP